VSRSGQGHQQLRTQTDAAARLLESLDSLRIAITIFDPDGRLAHANAHLNFLFPFFPPAAELIGRPYEELIRMELAGGAVAAAALGQGVDAFIACRLRQLRDDSAPRDLLLADHRVLEIKSRRAKGGQCVLLWTDVTAARGQYARLEEAIALTGDAFAFYDADDRFIMGNALYAQLAGVTLDSIRGEKYAEVIRRVVESGRILVDGPAEEWMARRLRGHQGPASALTIRTASGQAYLVRDRATQDGGRALVFTDITDKDRAEKALAEQVDALARTRSALDASRARAEQQNSYLADLTHRLDQASARADSAKTTLLRTMSHELKTPLNAILGFSDLMHSLAGKLTPEQVREYSGLIHQGGNNLLRMINQIMDLTKISAGRYDLHRTTADAGNLLWQAREQFADRAEDKSITFDTSACPAGHMIAADEAVFSAMLHNLLDNAVSHTPQGTVVTLSVAQLRPGRIAIRVADNGPGVAPDDLARIQEPFEHAGSAAEHAKGAGLGLTLVKAFAELHDGELLLASEHGKGFCATILMPSAS
jgi:two-component system cell cycle sensor histidine kinase PleC